MVKIPPPIPGTLHSPFYFCLGRIHCKDYAANEAKAKHNRDKYFNLIFIVVVWAGAEKGMAEL